MTKCPISIKLKGHESFYIREGWLTKGIREVSKDELIFTSEYSTDVLGIGSNMVKSLRYWLQAVGLTEEIRSIGSKRIQKLTNSFGEIIFENDPYLEDIFTLWLLHYKLVSNFKLATSWYLFFNKLNVSEISKNYLSDSLTQLVKNIDVNLTFSDKSLKDDCTCIIKTYCFDKNDLRNPEDNLICPFTELNLLNKKNHKNEDVIEFLKPSFKKLNRLVIFYVIIDNLNKNNIKSTTIDNLLDEECNIGKVFNLDKNLINRYLDQLENEGLIKVNRTAGLNTIYINDELTTETILKKYYTSR